MPRWKERDKLRQTNLRELARILINIVTDPFGANLLLNRLGGNTSGKYTVSYIFEGFLFIPKSIDLDPIIPQFRLKGWES